VVALTGDTRRRAEWLQELCEVLAHERHPGEIYKLVLRAPAIAARTLPGHFVEVKCLPGDAPAGFDPLLRRPFSACEIMPEQGVISLIYRVVGRGTRVLSAAAPGQRLDLLGPLGKSFPDPQAGSGRLVLVGGGLGIPPMAAAARWAAAAGREAAVILGARTAHFLAGAAEVAASGLPVTVVTDDGTAGRKALVTEPLQEMAAAGQAGEVWACGPEGMLVAVKAACEQAGVPCYVSVERFMACGFGACIGCTIPRADGPGFYKTCQEGPVFPAAEVILGDH
jgi:dihydroorotate dehydrogenase electron transfer subunit